MAGNVVNIAKLPPDFPTHYFPGEFWEELGRTIATFAFLEDVLLRAIVALGMTREVSDKEADEQLEKLIATVKKSTSDTMSQLTDTYIKQLRIHTKVKLEGIDDLANDLKQATSVRNVLCHGSWAKPDADGRCVPFFCNKQQEFFQTPVDVAFLKSTRKATVLIVCNVMNSVTHMGWAFPGSPYGTQIF